MGDIWGGTNMVVVAQVCSCLSECQPEYLDQGVVAAHVEIRDYSFVYFDHIAMFEALYNKS